MVRKVPFSGMQLRASAYAKANASGTVISVTRLDTQTVLTKDCSSAGVRR
jgi:hypothetical protein